VLVLWFIIACGSDVDDVKGQGVGAVGIGGVCIMFAVVEGAGIDAVAVAVAVVVKYVGLFADDGNDTKVRIVDRGGACGDVDGDADGVVGAAVAVVGIVVIVVAVAALVVVTMWGWWGVSDIGGDVAEVEGMP
jgi:hypothetical protein